MNTDYDYRNPKPWGAAKFIMLRMQDGERGLATDLAAELAKLDGAGHGEVATRIALSAIGVLQQKGDDAGPVETALASVASYDAAAHVAALKSAPGKSAGDVAALGAAEAALVE